MTRRVAVTGGTGFIGSHLLRALSADSDCHVRALTRGTPPADDQAEWIQGAADDRGTARRLVKDCDIVFHLAGAIKARRSAEFTRANLISTMRLGEAIAETAPQAHFILLSSLAAREPDLSAYALSKHQAEAYLLDARHGIEHWTIVRPPLVYGPGDKETLKMFKAVQSGWIPLPPDHTGRISIIHVHDLITALIHLTDERHGLKTILEVDDGTAGGFSLRGLFTEMAAALDRKEPLRHIPRSLMLIFAQLNAWAAMLSGGTPMITPGKLREALHPDWVSRLTGYWSDTDWQAEYDLRRGLKETVHWYRRNDYLK